MMRGLVQDTSTLPQDGVFRWKITDSEYMGISWDFMEYLWNFMEFYGNFMEFQDPKMEVMEVR